MSKDGVLKGDVLEVSYYVAGEVLEQRGEYVFRQFLEKLFDRKAMEKGYQRSGEVSIGLTEKSRQAVVRAKVVKADRGWWVGKPIEEIEKIIAALDSEIVKIDIRIFGTQGVYQDHPSHPRYELKEWKVSLENVRDSLSKLVWSMKGNEAKEG